MKIDVLDLLDALDCTIGLKESDKKLCELFHNLSDENKEIIIRLMNALTK